MNMIFRKPALGLAVLALSTIAWSALPAFAQETPAPQQERAGSTPSGHHHDPAERQEHQLEFLTKKLNLTPDQVTQVKAIDDDTRQQMLAVREDSSVAKPDRHAKMMDIHKASQDRIRAVLTDDQKTKYDAMRAQMEQHREKREKDQGGQGASAPTPS
ncbi:MAG: Spy/CpxP family protein refolding chaperone [Acidobacteriota bacterium]|nr:Spy/CpxP family protein refolding chaperone [Acidobacteriota bacterium]